MMAVTNSGSAVVTLPTDTQIQVTRPRGGNQR